MTKGNLVEKLALTPSLDAGLLVCWLCLKSFGFIGGYLILASAILTYLNP